MAHLLIWGETREMLAGDLPAGPPADEVRSLAGLEAALDGRGAALVLADPALSSRPSGTRSRPGCARGGSAQAVLVAVADPADGDEVLRRFPFVDDLLVRPVTPLRLRRKLERAIEALGSRRAIRQLERAYSRRGEELSELNKIGVALSAERDIDHLLELILQQEPRDHRARTRGACTSSSAAQEPRNGNGDRLRFKLAQNDSVAVALRGVHDPPRRDLDRRLRGAHRRAGERGRRLPPARGLALPHQPLLRREVGLPHQVDAGRAHARPPGRGDRRRAAHQQEARPGAVLQPASLVDDQVMSFTTVDRNLVESLASQAAVAFENADLIQRMRKLFETFVHAAVAAIEQRDPTTSGHSERVAILTVGLAERVDAVGAGPFADLRFTRDQIQELRYARAAPRLRQGRRSRRSTCARGRSSTPAR